MRTQFASIFTVQNEGSRGVVGPVAIARHRPHESRHDSTGEIITTARSFDRQVAAAEPTVAVHGLAIDRIWRLGSIDGRINGSHGSIRGPRPSSRNWCRREPRSHGPPICRRPARCLLMRLHRACASNGAYDRACRAVPPDGDGLEEVSRSLRSHPAWEKSLLSNHRCVHYDRQQILTCRYGAWPC